MMLMMMMMMFFCLMMTTIITQVDAVTISGAEIVDSTYFQLSLLPTPSGGFNYNLSFFDAIGNHSLSDRVVALKFDRIDEVDPEGNVVATTKGDNTSVFVVSGGNISSAANPYIPYAKLLRRFSNNCTAEFIYYVYYHAENITFGPTVLVLYGGAVKFTLTLDNWPFKATNNTIKWYVPGTFYNILVAPSNIRTDSRGSVIQVGVGVQVEGAPPFAVNFPDIIEADGNIVPAFVDVVTLALSPNLEMELVFEFPYGKHLFYDPDIGLLFEPSSSSSSSGGGSGDGGSSSDSTTLGVAIAIPIFVVLATIVVIVVVGAGLGYLTWRKRHIRAGIRAKTVQVSGRGQEDEL